MQLVARLHPQFAQAKRPIRFILADGRKVMAGVALLMEFGDTDTDRALDLLLDWLEAAAQKGEASEAELQALAQACGVRYKASKHPECIYPNIYLMAQKEANKGALVWLFSPEDLEG